MAPFDSTSQKIVKSGIRDREFGMPISRLRHAASPLSLLPTVLIVSLYINIFLLGKIVLGRGG